MHRLCLATAIACLALPGCGKKDKDKPAGDSARTTAPATATPTTAKRPASKWLTAANLGHDNRVPVDALAAAYQKWKTGTEVTLAGYAKFSLGEEGTLTNAVDLVAEPGKKGGHDKLVRCTFSPPINQKVTNKSPLIIKATMDRSWGRKKFRRHLLMNKCSLVSYDKPFDPKVPAIPGSAKPVAVATFSADFFGFEGKQVAVVGRYWGQTTSRIKGKVKSIRIDITGKSGTKVAACYLDAKPADAQQQAINKKRDGIVFKGTLVEPRMGMIAIEDCVIANR